METGLALPSSVPGTSGRDVLDWAVEGERAGFTTLAALDRLVFDSYECLTVLAAVAAVTRRVRLATAVALAPLRTNTALLAKQVATVDRLCAGRLVLGLAVGSRPDDFAASGADYGNRGRRFGEQIAELRRIWAGQRCGFAGRIGPAPLATNGPPLILGGHAPAAIRRAALHGDGWICGAGGPGMFLAGARAVGDAWRAGGRSGRPRLMALVYFALGDDAHDIAGRYLRGYYGFAPPYAQTVLDNAAIGESGVLEALAGFRQAGCDELLFVPCTADLRQVELLAGVLAGAAAAARGAPDPQGFGSMSP